MISTPSSTRTPSLPPSEPQVDGRTLLRQFVALVRELFPTGVISFFVGVALGLAYYYLSPPTYFSSLTAFSQNVEDTQIAIIIDELTRMTKEKDYEGLERALKLPPEVLEKLGKVEVSINQDKLSNQESYQFQVMVYVSDQDILDTLQASLIGYLNSSNYAQREIDRRKAELRANIVEIDTELASLEALKADLQTLLVEGQGNSNLFFSNLSEISVAIVNLTIRKNEARRELREFEEGDVQVVKEFVKFKKQYAPRLGKTLIFWVLVAEVIGLLAYLVTKRRDLLFD